MMAGKQNSATKILPSMPSDLARSHMTIDPGELMSPKMKTRILVACLMSKTVGNMTVTNLVAFLPQYISAKNKALDGQFQLSTFEQALIIAIFQLAQLCLSPFTSIVKNYFGTKNAIVGGFFVEAVCMALLGAVSVYDDAQKFKGFAIALRYIQGLGDMLMQVSCYSTITYTFSDNLIKYCAMTEICIGIGLACGPALGSLVFDALQFEYTLYLFGAICLVACIADILLLPSFLNKGVSEEAKSEIASEMRSISRQDLIAVYESKDKRVVNWMTILTNTSVMCTLLCVLMGCVNMQFWVGGYMSIHMGELGMEQKLFGYIVFAQGIVYLAGNLLFPFTCIKLPTRMVMALCMLGFGICGFLIGPSEWLNFPDNPYIIAAGILLQGIFNVGCNIPIVPELVDRL